VPCGAFFFMERLMKLSKAYLLLACFAASPALAQASAAITSGNLSGTAQAGKAQAETSSVPPINHPAERQVARGPRTDDTTNCEKSGVTVRSGNGSSSASASVSGSPGGAAAVAGSGSPGSRVEYFGCETTNRSQR
jgi:hypothetical protein